MTPPTVQFIPASGLSLTIHDAFGGSGSITGRTPDTVDNGNTWAWQQYQSDTAFTISSSTCYAVSDSTRSHSAIDAGSTAFRVEAVWQSQSVTTDEGRFGLVVDSTDADNHVRFTFQENLLYLQEISGGSFTNTLLASGLGMSASTDYRMVATIDGDAYDISIVDVATSSTITNHTGTLVSTVNGYVGKWFRRANSATHCSDFKVYT